MSAEPLSIRIDPERAGKTLGVIVAVLVVLSLIGQFFRLYLGHGRVFGFVAMFNLNTERNVPTYFSSIALLSASLLSAFIAASKSKAKDKFRRHWTMLAFVFLFMSVDEMSTLHERFNILQERFQTEGLLYFAWVIPGVLVVLLFVVAYLRFFFHLQPEFKVLFGLSALLYVGGAIGVEMISASFWQLYSNRSPQYMVAYTIEETLELLGITLFVYTLLKYIAQTTPVIRLHVGSKIQPQKNSRTLESSQVTSV